MAPRARGRSRGGRARGGGRRAGGADHAIPSVYREMMHDAGDAEPSADDDARPRKRPRRAGERLAQSFVKPGMEGKEEEDIDPPRLVPSSPPAENMPQQTVEDDSESELEFEDVEVGGATAGEEMEETLPEPMKGHEEAGFSVVAKQHEDQRGRARARRKRRPVTSAEKSMRLAVHKMHVLYLLYYVFYRNHWCNDKIVQAMLKQTVPARMVQLLNPDSRASQAQSSSFFLLGLNQICDLFHERFRVTSLGLRRPQWAATAEDLANFELPEGTEKPLELGDFRRAANSMQGSADLGAQLFCCLLRAVGVEARLVCSLQLLGFASAAELGTSASTTPVKNAIYLDDTTDVTKTSHVDSESDSNSTPKRIARIGQPRNIPAPEISQASATSNAKPFRIDRPSYPVFWIEAYNAAHQKWIAVDPIATHTVNRPSRLEPGVNDPKSLMTYAIAFEEDGVARDVTRRYTKAYTAKTRKVRVENTENGTSWLRKALAPFRRSRGHDKDQFEDAELTAKAAAEGMPRNVQEFKGHPVYALERHLRRNEIIHPKTESGRINVGTAANPKFEIVYRAANVHVVKSADKWFRLGREIKFGEQPLKHAFPRRGTRVRESPLDPDTVEDIGVGLYAAFQTRMYVPPAVGADGKLPKNRYGNIDVFVPSMIPEGAVWIRMPEARRAAKMLGIEYADAVTGFDFQGRHGTARIDGVIVAEDAHEAMEIACEAIRNATAEELEEGKRRECLRLWRRFLVGMREVRRIEGYLRKDENEGEVGKHGPPDEPELDTEDQQGGGFTVDDEDEQARPVRTRRMRSSSEGGGGFLAESDDGGSDAGGGFLVDSDDQDSGSGGGFVPDDEEETVTEDDIDDGSGRLREQRRSRPSKKSSPEHDADATDEARISDAGPFGFASIRVPQSSRAALLTGDARESQLPRVIRGMKRQTRENGDSAARDTLPMDIDTTPTQPRVNNKATEDHSGEKADALPDAVVVSYSERTSVEPGGFLVDNEPEAPAEADIQVAHIMEEAATRGKEATGPKAASREGAPPPVQKEEEPPVSSYEYDDDMLLEDPEDEDAEPEWLA